MYVALRCINSLCSFNRSIVVIIDIFVYLELESTICTSSIRQLLFVLIKSLLDRHRLNTVHTDLMLLIDVGFRSDHVWASTSATLSSLQCSCWLLLLIHLRGIVFLYLVFIIAIVIFILISRIVLLNWSSSASRYRAPSTLATIFVVIEDVSAWFGYLACIVTELGCDTIGLLSKLNRLRVVSELAVLIRLGRRWLLWNVFEAA